MTTFRIWREAKESVLQYTDIEANTEAEALAEAEKDAEADRVNEWKDADADGIDEWTYSAEALD